jgi:homoserine O-acetyltransferase/O-succinyltransferase
VFAAQSYLRYQGDKFVNRFDANCYLRITEMLDSHDLSLGRGPVRAVLASIQQPTLIIGAGRRRPPRRASSPLPA